MSAIDDVMKYIATNEIRWIDLQFYDIKGQLHRVSVSDRKARGVHIRERHLRCGYDGRIRRERTGRPGAPA